MKHYFGLITPLACIRETLGLDFGWNESIQPGDLSGPTYYFAVALLMLGIVVCTNICCPSLALWEYPVSSYPFHYSQSPQLHRVLRPIGAC